jgi:hypothetical protein
MEEKKYYSEKRISSSSLKYFEQSPLQFKKFLDKEIELEEKSYLTKGKQIHMAILEPKEFKKNYTHLEFDTPSSAQQKQFCEDYITTNDLLLAYKNNYKTTSKDEKVLELANELKDKLSRYIEYLSTRKQFKDVLSNTDWERIKDLKENCHKHKKAKELVFNDDLDTRTILNEFVILWEHPMYKLPCKSMIDRLIIDHNNKKVILIDLKTANTFNKFKERCNEFSYFRQMAFYWMAINWYFVNELKLNFEEYTKETYIVALKTVDDPEVKVYNITEQNLKDGWLDMTEIFTQLAWHWENDKWEYTRTYYIGDGDERL